MKRTTVNPKTKGASNVSPAEMLRELLLDVESGKYPEHTQAIAVLLREGIGDEADYAEIRLANVNHGEAVSWLGLVERRIERGNLKSGSVS
jgi:hypothetical protein